MQQPRSSRPDLSGLPPMPELPKRQPKPANPAPAPEPANAASLAVKRVRRIAPVSAAGRGKRSPRAIAATRRAAAEMQPRDPDGKFATKGLSERIFGPALHPTRLRRVKRPSAPTSQPAPRSFKKIARKKPLQPRNFFGRLRAVFNGDYVRWRRRQQRAQVIREQKERYGAPLKHPKRRIRRHVAPPQRAPQGRIRRFLSRFE